MLLSNSFKTSLVFAIILNSSSANAQTYLLGDLAPRGVPDGQLNAADNLLLQRMVLGEISPTTNERFLGDIAPLGSPDGVLNVGDIVVQQRAILGLINLGAINTNTLKVVGKWLGGCKEIYPGEYQQEELKVTYTNFSHSFYNSVLPNCSNPWLAVVKQYTYEIDDSIDVEFSGIELDLNLTEVFVSVNSTDVSTALNLACNRDDIILDTLVPSSAVICSGGVQYPAAGVNHYELIKKSGDILYLGDKRDVVNETNRVSDISLERGFTKFASGEE